MPIPRYNNIETMKFIPVVPARVFVKAERVPLPNPLMGFWRLQARWPRFPAEHGRRWARLCSVPELRPAESMLSATDAPKSMEAHYPLRALPVNLIATARISGLSAPDPQHRIRINTLRAGLHRCV